MKNNKKQQQKPAKTYATNTTRSCVFSKDYSYYINHKCLECKFCYSNIEPKPSLIEKAASRVNNEKFYNANLYDVPITVSRYIDPLLSDVMAAEQSYRFMVDILNNGGQIIFKTSQAEIPEKIIDLFKEYRENILVQLRLVADKTFTGAIVQKTLAPRFSSAEDIFKTAYDIKHLHNLDVAFILDPFIIGINDRDLPSIIRRANDIGINKIVVRQLFSTAYFKEYLSKVVDKKFIDILTDNYNNYITYNNDVFLGAMMPALEEIEKHNGFDIGVCGNKYINSLVCKNNNCCLFDNPNGMYDIEVNAMYRAHNNVIILKDKDVKI